jgi:hypothetical protein
VSSRFQGYLGLSFDLQGEDDRHRFNFYFGFQRRAAADRSPDADINLVAQDVTSICDRRKPTTGQTHVADNEAADDDSAGQGDLREAQREKMSQAADLAGDAIC